MPQADERLTEQHPGDEVVTLSDDHLPRGAAPTDVSRLCVGVGGGGRESAGRHTGVACDKQQTLLHAVGAMILFQQSGRVVA